MHAADDIDDASSVSEPSAKETANTHPVRVLIVDHHTIARKALTMFLTVASEFELVGSAENGEVGCAMAAACKPDVVMMELRLPVMDGIEATRRIKAANPGIQVLINTALVDDAVIRLAIEAGAIGCISKASHPREIPPAIQGAARGEPQFDERLMKAFLSHRRKSAPSDT